jgi:4-amino-4-deoxy-L-arabinose transferase-like glycosyltransferase
MQSCVLTYCILGCQEMGSISRYYFLKITCATIYVLVPCYTAHATTTTVDALMRWFAVFGVVLLWI